MGGQQGPQNALEPLSEAPSTYAEWVRVLERFGRSEDDLQVARAFAAGTIEWTAGVAPRLTNRLSDATSARVKAVEERFNRDLKHARGDVGAIAKALLTLRKGLAQTASMLSAAQGLPSDVRDGLVKFVHNSADAAQKSLEDGMQGDRTGRLRQLVRTTPVNKF